MNVCIEQTFNKKMKSMFLLESLFSMILYKLIEKQSYIKPETKENLYNRCWPQTAIKLLRATLKKEAYFLFAANL